jgi:hypothetical protein
MYRWCLQRGKPLDRLISAIHYRHDAPLLVDRKSSQRAPLSLSNRPRTSVDMCEWQAASGDERPALRSQRTAARQHETDVRQWTRSESKSCLDDIGSTCVICSVSIVTADDRRCSVVLFETEKKCPCGWLRDATPPDKLTYFTLKFGFESQHIVSAFIRNLESTEIGCDSDQNVFAWWVHPLDSTAPLSVYLWRLSLLDATLLRTAVSIVG